MVMKQQGMQFDRMDFSSLLWQIPLLQPPKGSKEGKKEREKESQHHCLETLVEAGKTAGTAPGCHLKMEALLPYSKAVTNLFKLLTEHKLRYIRCIMTSYNS